MGTSVASSPRHCSHGFQNGNPVNGFSIMRRHHKGAPDPILAPGGRHHLSDEVLDVPSCFIKAEVLVILKVDDLLLASPELDVVRGHGFCCPYKISIAARLLRQSQGHEHNGLPDLSAEPSVDLQTRRLAKISQPESIRFRESQIVNVKRPSSLLEQHGLYPHLSGNPVEPLS
jgi:hypothetical protein